MSDETQSLPEKFNESLFYNYSLTEIKSLEDSAKQVMSVNAIITGVYIALIINNQSFEAIRTVSNGMPLYPFGIMFIWFFLLAPIVLWFISGVNPS